MRIACYERVSTEEQGQHGISIDAQAAALEEWAKGHTIVDHYTDIGVSGRKPHNKRPEMVRLLGDIEADRIDLVIFCRLDRWFRSVKEYYKVQDILDRHKTAWRAVQEDYETQTASGRFKVNIMLSVAQDEAERTGERIKAVNEFKRRKGEFCSGNTPLGTKLENKLLVPSDDAWIVKELFNSFISTGTAKGAQAALLDKGVQLKEGTLRYMLDNPNYAEIGVISKEVWTRAQELRAIPRPKTFNRRTYLFNGLAFCSCGRRLTGMYSYGNYYYRCPGFYQDNECSVNKCFREDEIESYLLKTIIPQCEKYNITISKKSKKKDPAPIRLKMDKLTDLYLSDLVSREKYERDYTALKKQLEDMERDETVIPIPEIRDILGIYDTFSREAKRTFWLRVLSRIEVSEDKINYTPCFIKG